MFWRAAIAVIGTALLLPMFLFSVFGSDFDDFLAVGFWASFPATLALTLFGVLSLPRKEQDSEIRCSYIRQGIPEPRAFIEVWGADMNRGTRHAVLIAASVFLSAFMVLV